jgi:TctA family transporter
MDNSDRSESIKWILVMVVTGAIGVFIFSSKSIPDNYMIPLAIVNFAVFYHANRKLVMLRKKARENANQVKDTRASRRQTERLKNK